MNPYALTGPQFLLFYLGAIIAVGLLILLLRAGEHRAGRYDEGLVDRLSGIELGFLRHGAEGAVTSAIAGMLQREQLCFVDDDVLTVVPGNRPQAQRIEQSSYRVDPIASHSTESRLALAIYECIESGTRHIDSIVRSCRTALAPIELQLIEKELLVPREALRTRQLAIGSAVSVLLMIGAGRLVQGIMNQRPFGFLLVEMVVAGGLFLLYPRKRRTAWAERVLGDARERYAAVGETASSAPEQLSADEASLGAGVFGGAALMIMSPGLYALSQNYVPDGSFAAPDSGSNSSDSSSSNWFSGGGSCGSSCGGSSCGGGCGGCGGCGG